MQQWRVSRTEQMGLSELRDQGGIWQGRRTQCNLFFPTPLQGLSMHISWDNHSNSHHSQPQ